MVVKQKKIWVLSDGKMGDEQQCIGVAQSLGFPFEIKRIQPRAPWHYFMPYGPIDPKESSYSKGSPLSPPFPDMVIASGRRSVPYLKHLKKASQGKIFTVFLKDPRIGNKIADFIWAPEHDKITGRNVFKTRFPPHRLSQEALRKARENPDPRLIHFSSPKVSVLVGGDSHHHKFTSFDSDRLLEYLRLALKKAGSLLITTSRRTPLSLHKKLEDFSTSQEQVFLWNGEEPNPYIDLIALADWIVVTTDSYNLVGEALASGKPLLLFSPQGGHPKFNQDLEYLIESKRAYPFDGKLVGTPYDPIDISGLIADRIHESYEQFLVENFFDKGDRDKE